MEPAALEAARADFFRDPKRVRHLELHKIVADRVPLPGTDAGRVWSEYRRLGYEIDWDRPAKVKMKRTKTAAQHERAALRRARQLAADVRVFTRGADVAPVSFNWPARTVYLLERLARLVRKAAGVGLQEHVPMVILATRILGPRGLETKPDLFVRGMLSRDGGDGRYRIALRAGMYVPLRELVIGHELAHWIIDRELFSHHAGRSPHSEAWCDYIGVALMRPSWGAR